MDQQDKTDLKVFGPLAALVVVLAAAVVTALFLGAHEVDRNARLREEALVTSGMRQSIGEMEHSTAAEVIWDDAVKHLDNHYDAAWAETNIGQFFSNTAGFDGAFVVDKNAHPLYAMQNGNTANLATFAAVSTAAADLIDRVRQGEARRGPFVHRARSKEMVAKPIQASQIALVGGKPAVVSATLVEPDFGTAYPAGARAPVVITVKNLDADFLTQIGQRFDLTGLRLFTGKAAQKDMATAALKDGTGVVIATLVWSPQTPGTVLMTRSAPLILIVILALGAAALVLFRRGRKAANSLVASEARATHMAHHDALTSLPNRLLFTERLDVAVDQLRRGKGEVTVLCIDLDRFKDVNDTLGHQCGDELIVEAARRLRSVCRKADTLARLGGDEFAIVHEGGAKGAVAVASRILEVLNGPADLSGGQVHLAGSVGVTVITDTRLDGEEALRQADVALYRAKAAGRGQYCFFEPEMDQALRIRRSVEADLRLALPRGEFVMAYQPQMQAGKMFGVEALLRWNHPTRGAVSPAYFIPIAEDCGLIDEIGMFTLRRAFFDSHNWPGLQVAVNVSARQLAMPDFAHRTEQLLIETRVQATQIELEITEGMLLADDQDTHDTLNRLRQMGFTLALDDFGTGYSSLAYLRRFPIDKIKIDRSFITNLGIDVEADAVVKAIIKLARALNLSIIAEGVETAEQHDRLVAAGCSREQGFLYSKAVPASQICDMLKAPKIAAKAA